MRLAEATAAEFGSGEVLNVGHSASSVVCVSLKLYSEEDAGQ